MPRKRGHEEMEASEAATVPVEQDLRTKLRNTWEFANIMQFIHLFGHPLKIDEDFDIDALEQECLRPESSDVLADVGLKLLKWVSSHRGLTPELFDEYTRRQFVAKAPNRNPYGTGEIPNKFADFDVFTKLKVLVQLSQWVFWNPDRIRDKMAELGVTDQTQWRIDSIGRDKKDRLYFVLDDNRLYRRTDPPLPPEFTSKPKPKPKAKAKTKAPASRKARTAPTRSSARVKAPEPELSEEELEPEEDPTPTNNIQEDSEEGTWECVAVTLPEYQDFLESIQRSKDRNEKDLHLYLTNNVLPEIEKMEERRQKKIARQQRELENLQKLATAKKSSRIAGKQERERQEQEAAAARKKLEEDLKEAKRHAERQKKMEEARESRMLTREMRLKDRETKRILREAELANLSEDSKKLENDGEARMSERRLKAEMAKKKKELEALAAEEETWMFDCAKCGVYGENIDDGAHSVACERCNVWQHSACLGISQTDAEKDDFRFICMDCIRREEDSKKPKIPALKLRAGPSSSPPMDSPTHPKVPNIKLRTGPPSSPPIPPPAYPNGHAVENRKRKSDDTGANSHLPPMKKFKYVDVPRQGNGHSNVAGYSAYGPVGNPRNAVSTMRESLMNGPTLSPQGQLPPSMGANGFQARPPGLSSPTRPHPDSHSRQYQTNGQYQYSHQAPHAARDITHSSPSGISNTGYASYNYQQPSIGQTASRPQSFQQSPNTNPYHNSFNRQRPLSSNSNISTNGFSTPVNGFGTPSNPRQLETPPPGSAFIPAADFRPYNHATPQSAAPAHTHTSSSFTAGPLPDKTTPQSTPLQPTSTFSPLLATTPSANSYTTLAGGSPKKLDTPRPTAGSEISGTAVMPPVAHLSPSPAAQNLHPPVKGTPEQNGSNGTVNRS